MQLALLEGNVPQSRIPLAGSHAQRLLPRQLCLAQCQHLLVSGIHILKQRHQKLLLRRALQAHAGVGTESLLADAAECEGAHKSLKASMDAQPGNIGNPHETI